MSSALLLATLVQTIWIVDAANGPGTNFTDLPAAVAAAISGDTILVRPGTYTHFNVSGKALTIRGAGAALTTVQLNGQFPFPDHLRLPHHRHPVGNHVLRERNPIRCESGYPEQRLCRTSCRRRGDRRPCSRT